MSGGLILQVIGSVRNPRQFTFEELQGLDPAEQIADVSQLDAKRRGTAVRLRGLLAAVEPTSDARYLTLHAGRDDFHASIPLAAVVEQSVLIYSLDGKPLPVEMGGPFRFFVPNHLACHTAEIDECANVKFVDCLELSAAPGHDNRPADERAHAALHRDQT
jgi:DMSO/TMAO reductase YedYZ molybdopterin-dependent catalytic subunit